jgi:hypothetical protein
LRAAIAASGGQLTRAITVSVFGIEAISARRRCVVRSMASSSGRKLKQPYAIFMKDGSPFGIGGLWEN